MITFPPNTSKRVSLLRPSFRGIAMAAILSMGCWYAAAADHAPAHRGCPIDAAYTATLDFSGPSDINVARAYGETALQMVKDKKYAELDCFADRVRSGKEKLPDGRWKLDVFYSGLASPAVYPADSNPFGLWLTFSANGTVEKAQGSSNEPAVCILRKISESHASESPLIAPSPTYKPSQFGFDIDPADFTSMASNR